MNYSRWCLLSFFCVSVLFAPISTYAEEDAFDDEDPFADESSEVVEEEVSDPIEGWNRGVFWFNDKLDRYVLEPVADGYDYIMPDRVQTGVTNVFENLLYPRYLVSSVVQLKFGQAAEHTGRFLINSTLGLAGLVDVATHLGLEQHSEDFGTALGYHRVPPGPYLMLPFFGPSNIRDGFGKIVDNFLSPIPYIASATADSQDAILITLGANAVDIVQTRANFDEAIEAARDASVDYYLFVQSAYYQRRRALIFDEKQEEQKPVEEQADPFADDEALDAELGEQF
ncbi:MAG: VacJ family lipoprotein [Bdellovibrionales bacterium]|nr:VacJ family lipoprotein [Bdellovibrionales bacterium]